MCHIGVKGNRLYLYILRLYTLDSRIAEAHIGEARAVGLLAVPAGIGCGGFGTAQEGRVQCAVRVQDLGVAHRNDLTGTALQRYADNARKVLAEVVDRFPVRRGSDGHRLEHLMGRDRRTVLCRNGGGDLQGLGGSSVPAICLMGGIIGFTVIQVGHADGAVLGDLPAAVGSDDLHTAVSVLDTQLGKQCLPVGRDAVFAGKNEAANGPAACHCGSQRVMAGQKLRYIVGLILQIALVACKAGGKILPPQLLAVQLYLIDAHSGCIKPRTGNGLCGFDRFAKDHRHGADLGLGKGKGRVADPLTAPGGLHAAGFKGGFCLGGCAGIIGDCQPDTVGRKGQQRRPLVGGAGLAILRQMNIPIADLQNGIRKLGIIAVALYREADARRRAVSHTALGQMLHSQAGDLQHLGSSFFGRA